MNVNRNNNIAVVSSLKVSLQEIVFLTCLYGRIWRVLPVCSLKQIHWFGNIWELLHQRYMIQVSMVMLKRSSLANCWLHRYLAGDSTQLSHFGSRWDLCRLFGWFRVKGMTTITVQSQQSTGMWLNHKKSACESSSSCDMFDMCFQRLKVQNIKPQLKN